MTGTLTDDLVDMMERSLDFQSTASQANLEGACAGTASSNFAIMYVDPEALPDLDIVFASASSAALNRMPHANAALAYFRATGRSSRGTWRLADSERTPGLGASILVDTSQKDAATLAESVLSGYGLTKTQLAAIAGVSRQSVHGWLRGSQDMSSATNARLTQLDHLLAALTAAGVRRPGAAISVPIFPDRQSAADRIRLGLWKEDGDTALLVEQATPRPRDSFAVNSERVMRQIDKSGRLLSRDE